MSQAHAVAPMIGAEASFHGRVHGIRSLGPRLAHRRLAPATSGYVERALLLWPRLDRAKIRKVADNPVRIAEIVERRTSQPFDAILAMLTKQAPALSAPTEDSTGFDAARPETARFALRIVRSEEGGEIQVQDLLPD
jgi:hypothetical protein